MRMTRRYTLAAVAPELEAAALRLAERRSGKLPGQAAASPLRTTASDVETPAENPV